MAKIRWTNLALNDLQDIYDYVAKDSPKFADRLMDKIIERVDVLEHHPKIGRKVPEFDNEQIRELIEGNYRIIYRIESDDQLGIARVHHAARMLKEL
jgi:addiction module RelE/StbE family toxin